MYEKLSKNALKCMYIATATGTIIMLVIAVVLEIALFIPNEWTIAHIITVICVILLALNALISPWFRYNRYRYKIDDECIDIIEGYIFISRDIVPIERLHKLEMNIGPIDRICGVAKVNVTTAGGDVTIRFLDKDKAEKISETLKQRINTIVAEQKEIAKATEINSEKRGTARR